MFILDNILFNDTNPVRISIHHITVSIDQIILLFFRIFVFSVIFTFIDKLFDLLCDFNTLIIIFIICRIIRLCRHCCIHFKCGIIQNIYIRCYTIFCSIWEDPPYFPDCFTSDTNINSDFFYKLSTDFNL